VVVHVQIVVVNHVTTRLDKGTGRSQIVPALGDVWSHAITNRLMLQWKVTVVGDTTSCLCLWVVFMDFAYMCVLGARLDSESLSS
jgi:hypothetical protein